MSSQTKSTAKYLPVSGRHISKLHLSLSRPLIGRVVVFSRPLLGRGDQGKGLDPVNRLYGRFQTGPISDQVVEIDREADDAEQRYA